MAGSFLAGSAGTLSCGYAVSVWSGYVTGSCVTGSDEKLPSSVSLQACRKPEVKTCKAICDQGLLGSKLDVVGVVDMSTDAELLGCLLGQHASRRDIPTPA